MLSWVVETETAENKVKVPNGYSVKNKDVVKRIPAYSEPGSSYLLMIVL